VINHRTYDPIEQRMYTNAFEVKRRENYNRKKRMIFEALDERRFGIIISMN
jgi:hypothetical protein